MLRQVGQIIEQTDPYCYRVFLFSRSKTVPRTLEQNRRNLATQQVWTL